MKNRILAGAIALVSSVALGGCGFIPGSGSGDRTVTVWLMKDSVSPGFLDKFTRSYEEENPSIELDFKIQEWSGIGPKVLSALDGDDAPDVIEVGNTQVAQYAESGGLRDLTLESMRDLGSEDWLPGLAQPGSINGVQYGIPWYAANRVVIYNKEIFEEAGIDSVPKTRDEWIAATEKLNRAGNQGIYLAGQNWYVLAGFIWDEGGELADENGGDWQGALDTPQALAGMEFYQELQALGDGPTDADEEKPRRPTSSPRATSRRSSRLRAVPRSSSRRIPNSRESSATSPFPASPRRPPARFSPADPTSSSRRRPTSAPPASPSSRRWRARSGRRSSPGA